MLRTQYTFMCTSVCIDVMHTYIYCGVYTYSGIHWLGVSHYIGNSILSSYIHTAFLPVGYPPPPASASSSNGSQARRELEDISLGLFTNGLAEATRRTYASAQKRYATFCSDMQLTPLPLTEYNCCLFVSFLAMQGLSAQSVSAYLSAIRHWHIEAGFGSPPTSLWPRLHYVLRGVKRQQAGALKRTRLPITPDILTALFKVWAEGQMEPEFEARLLWAACCVCFFGFFRAGELLASQGGTQLPPVQLGDVAVDDHCSPSMLRIHLKKAKTDPFGRGVEVFLGKTGQLLCPVTALLGYLGVRPRTSEKVPLFVNRDGTPLAKESFVRRVKAALTMAGINHQAYSGHSFRIGAASTAASRNVPSHMIKMLGRWSSDAYMLYIHQPRTRLAAISSIIAAPQDRRHPN